MKIRWTTPARQDLIGIMRYIRRDKPMAAHRVGVVIRERVASLSSFELRHRKGQVEGTNELIIRPWPYIVVYRVLLNEIQIIRVRHAAQEYP